MAGSGPSRTERVSIWGLSGEGVFCGREAAGGGKTGWGNRVSLRKGLGEKGDLRDSWRGAGTRWKDPREAGLLWGEPRRPVPGIFYFIFWGWGGEA